jgi:hypothetical protein
LGSYSEANSSKTTVEDEVNSVRRPDSRDTLSYKYITGAEEPMLKYMEVVERIARVLGQVAIPVVIAIIGVLIQNSLATMNARQKYVELAVTLLTTSKDEVDQELRAWAVEVLQVNSPIPLKPETAWRLKTGDIILPERSCQNECSYWGAKRWLDAFHYQICGNYDCDPCLEWSDPIYCPQGQTPSETP